jgi:LmbE family N-acetylglucosaminyl deacetylase
LRLLAERPGSTVHWVALASTLEREREARASAAQFLSGAAAHTVVIKQFRDGYLPFQGPEIKDFFEATKAAVKPDLILTHHRQDRHQDHRLVAEMTWNTYRNHLIAEFEIPKYEGDLGMPNLFVPLSEVTARRKIAVVLRSFQSQGTKGWFRAETFEAVLRLRGIECNAPEGFAEAFHVSKLVV